MSELLRKLGTKAEARSIVIEAPAEVRKAVSPPGSAKRLAGTFDYIHVFVRDQKGLKSGLVRLKPRLRKGGTLWVSWPKGGGQGTDLSLPKVIEIGYRKGLVESKAISIDAVWSALKFTFPKEGKVYNNSFGKLP